MTRYALIALTLLALVPAGCAPPLDVEPSSADELDGHIEHLDDVEIEARTANGAVTIAGVAPFRQVGLLVETDADALPVRVSHDGIWSEPTPAEITWREGPLVVARVVLDAPADAFELLRPDELDAVSVQLYPEVRARLDWPLAREMPPANDADVVADGALRRVRQLLPGFVITRSAWGARDPSRVCGSPHTPRYVTVHHTVTPTHDSISGAARVRGIQAYHIDSNGWCDIGYHFLVDSDGNVYQGRSSEQRTGAHAGGANTDNVGVSFLGTFTSDVPSDAMFSGGAQILAWLADAYAIALDRSRVKGHREWGSTACPGDALYARLQHLIDLARGDVTDPDPEPEPEPETWDVTVDARYLGTTDRLTDGTSAGISDVLPGEAFEAELLVTNGSSAAIRDVRIGYLVEDPWVAAASYRIETDHPAYDRTSWVINSADSEPANPARDALGVEGELWMHAFSPRETKRVVLELVAGPPSLGRADHPDVRVWLSNVGGVYAQDAWDGTPSPNEIGRVVRDYDQIDVLSDSAWFFDGSDAADTEGWAPCDVSAVDRFEVDVAQGALEVHVAGPEPCVTSPEWTSVDADLYSELALRLRSHDGAHRLTLSWRREGEAFAAARSVAFDGVGDGVFQTYVVPVGRHADWSGLVDGLRLTPTATATGGSDWYDIDSVWVQSVALDQTSGFEVEPATDAPVPLFGFDDPGDEPSADATPDGGWDDSSAPGGDDPGASGPGGSATEDAPRSPQGGGASRGRPKVRGCSFGRTPTAPTWTVVIFLGLTRRRY